MTKLTAPDGGTDFGPPLAMAKTLMDKYHNNYDSFVLVMMSDGEADYPHAIIESIKKSPAKGKLKFKSIQYGDRSNIGGLGGFLLALLLSNSGGETLRKMAQELGGTSDNIIEPG